MSRVQKVKYVALIFLLVGNVFFIFNDRPIGWAEVLNGFAAGGLLVAIISNMVDDLL